MAENLDPGPIPCLPASMGPWQPTAHLGDGNWSRVYQAQPVGLSAADPADYAIKQLHAELQDDPLARNLLAREITIGKSVSHPHLLPVLDSGVSEHQPYLVMPLLSGFSPTSTDSREPYLAISQTLWMLRQVSQGIAALHQHGWIHADIKPANIMISMDGHATLFDFGLARKIGSEECGEHSPFVGTLSYSAPEMIHRTSEVGTMADVYSLGVTAYELFTGRTPFWDVPFQELATAQLEYTPPSARRWVPGLYREINQLVLSMLAKQPVNRPRLDTVIDTLVRLEVASFAERTPRRPVPAESKPRPVAA